MLRDVSREVDGVQVLANVHLDIPDRQFTAVIGPSGSGKTSLLRLLNRLDEPSAGTIRYHGRPIGDLPVRDHRRRVGFVFQTPVMFPGCVRDNLVEAAELADIPPEQLEQRMDACLGMAEVDPSLLERDAGRLSVGQQQRVSIARTLMAQPETLLLDEPTASLDPETADKLMSTIARLSIEAGVTIVAATHRLEEARRMSGYLVMLEQGRVIQSGTTIAMFDESKHPRLRSFLSRLS